MAHGYGDPVEGAKAALKRTQPLADLAKSTKLVPRPTEKPVSSTRPVKATDDQPKGMRSNVALRRKLSGGR